MRPLLLAASPLLFLSLSLAQAIRYGEKGNRYLGSASGSNRLIYIHES